MASSINASTSGGGGIITTADATGILQLQSAGTATVTVDASGNVGIGTASPTGRLHIKASASTFVGFAQENTNGGTDEKIVDWLNNGNTYSLRLVNDAYNAANSAYSVERSGYTVLAQVWYTGSSTERMRINSSGNVGIGTSSPSYQLQVNTDSAGKPGVGGLWTVVSDERIKSNIVNANLDRCYEIVKSVPLKHFGFAPGVYTDDQIQDKNNLGWIAQDVQKVFKNAVSVKPFTLKTDIPDGTEDYEEQDFTLEIIEKTETSIQVINGKPVQVSKVVTSENKVMLFDTVDVLDEAGDAVMDGDKPLTYQMPRMITKTRPKVRREVIEDCLDLNGGQMQAALYGAVQSLMEKIETLTTRITALEAK